MDRINKIISLIENGQHQEALKKYEQILQVGSNDEKFVLAEELFHYGFLEEARSLFERLLESYPEEGELIVLLAETYIELGDEDKAIGILDGIKKNDPSYPEALLLLADLYQMEGLYEVSEQKLLEAKEIVKDDVIIDFALGELYSEQGKFLEAIHSYQKVLQAKSEIAGVNVNQRLGEAYSAGGAFEEALPYFERAIEEKLEINTLFSYAFTALQAGYNKTAIEKFEELKVLDPEYHSLYLYLAKAYEREEELASSFEAIKEGIRQDEFNKDLFFYGGKIALKLGNEVQAEKMFREALALDPEFIEAAITLNKLLLSQERFEDVIEIVDEMNKNGEGEPQLLWDAAISYQNMEQYSQSLNKYRLAYTYFKNQPEFLKDFGYFLIEEGERHEAAEIFKKLLQLDSSNEEYLDILQRISDDFN
ncbi:tetratricopeptide repeat protein [Bacillus massilinigeriensis]|uniref:tetratricopeptide repeat protein n=1 Tax=Bacillus massilionigeriensis TaxID=1805475 RepID=UPI00096ADF9A|nr:tetratricopeptide repeat protein [Bacillus massilionigeriensis]